ncbi:unnamed protein product [Spirodela intermedia]|uniref:BHLH domain-containing protein n=2 Tax=Spirodela intermedia TaxID=51605 RepID=A0A7I8I9I5_SPIIN|nr:unnamed protein product [Spirodela intermedia]CAA6654134.1 unnamed protein product [Spirodela intermedia]CAA7388728.1 unnamed protein product [Spirodela intermedia]
MEGNSQGTFNHSEPVSSSVAVDTECVCEHALDAAVDEFEAQKNSFVAESLLPSPLYDQPSCDDVDLLSAIPLPPDGIPQEFIAKYGCWKADDDPEGPGHPPSKRLKRPPVFSEFHCHDQRDMLSLEDYLVSLCPCPVEEQLYEESYNAAVQSETAAVTVAAQGLCSKESTSSNAIDSRRRRAKIAEGIKALEESTPQSGKVHLEPRSVFRHCSFRLQGIILPCCFYGTRESVLDDAIDYIKYLKLQLLASHALGQSRLGGEPIHHPFVHLEGFGHYILHQQMRTEPLEEVMGHLMESNLPTAIRLLESKGLELLPISSADIILRAGTAL